VRLLKLARKTIEYCNKQAFNYLEGFIASDSPRISFALRSLEMSYEALNKKRIVLELKRARAQLKAYHNVREGSLLRTKTESNARPEISMSKYKSDWIKIPANVTLMFLGVEHDHNFDAVTLKVLWESRIYFIHKNANFKDFNNNFDDKFEVLL